MIKLLRTHPNHLQAPRADSVPVPSTWQDRSRRMPNFSRILDVAFQKTAPPPSGSKEDLVAPALTSPAPCDFPSPGTPGSEGLDDFIREASQKYGVERDLIRAVIKAESNYNPNAESQAGAVGLMQLLPSTADDMGVTDIYDPRENIFGGTRYLGMLLNRYAGNMERALAAYNWGPGNVERAPDRLPGETRTYIQRVLSYLETKTV